MLLFVAGTDISSGGISSVLLLIYLYIYNVMHFLISFHLRRTLQPVDIAKLNV